MRSPRFRVIRSRHFRMRFRGVENRWTPFRCIALQNEQKQQRHEASQRNHRRHRKLAGELLWCITMCVYGWQYHIKQPVQMLKAERDLEGHGLTAWWQWQETWTRNDILWSQSVFLAKRIVISASETMEISRRINILAQTLFQLEGFWQREEGDDIYA